MLKPHFPIFTFIAFSLALMDRSLYLKCIINGFVLHRIGNLVANLCVAPIKASSSVHAVISIGFQRRAKAYSFSMKTTENIGQWPNSKHITRYRRIKV